MVQRSCWDHFLAGGLKFSIINRLKGGGLGFCGGWLFVAFIFSSSKLIISNFCTSLGCMIEFIMYGVADSTRNTIERPLHERHSI